MPRSMKRGAKSPAPEAAPNLNLVDYTVALSRSVLVRGAVRGQVDPDSIEDRLARQRKRFEAMSPDDLSALVLTHLPDHEFSFA